VLKAAADEELVEAVRRAAAGESYLNPRLGARIAAAPPAGPPARAAHRPMAWVEDRLDPAMHEWRFAVVVALAAGVCVPLLALAVLLINGDPGGLALDQAPMIAAEASLLIAFEGACVLGGYLTLGRFLGLRPTT
jgi:hypothetical protein